MLIHWYRLAHWLWMHHVPVLPKLIYYLQYLLFNCSVPASCSLGGGYKVWLRWNCHSYSCQSSNRKELRHWHMRDDRWQEQAL